MFKVLLPNGIYETFSTYEKAYRIGEAIRRHSRSTSWPEHKPERPGYVLCELAA